MISRLSKARVFSAVLGLLGLLVGAALVAEVAITTMRSDRVNGVYTDLAAEIAPIELTGIRVELSSPSHRLEVMDHVLELAPGPEGDHRGRLWARIRGEAHLIARIEIGGLPGELEDEITLPEQEQEIVGRAEIERVEEGYRMTLLELPTHAVVRVESALAGNLVTVCEGLSIIPFMAINCDALEAAMSTLRLPLPEPGETHVLAPDDLTAEERRQIDAYLDRAK